MAAMTEFARGQGEGRGQEIALRLELVLKLALDWTGWSTLPCSLSGHGSGSWLAVIALFCANGSACLKTSIRNIGKGSAWRRFTIKTPKRAFESPFIKHGLTSTLRLHAFISASKCSF